MSGLLVSGILAMGPGEGRVRERAGAGNAVVDEPRFAGPLAPRPGAAEAWEQAMGVSPFAEVNLAHGNVLTVIPIVSWSGRGPSSSFSLAHNSAAASGGHPASTAAGFDLGAGWTVAYGGQVQGVSADRMRVIEDDGTIYEYARVAGAWTPPAGVYDRLEETPGGWRLTRKSQMVNEYDQQGRLARVVDPSGNALAVTRGPSGRMTAITDAAGRTLVLSYDAATGRLTGVSDPGVNNRNWYFAYDADGRLARVTDPMSFVTAIAYDSAGRITAVTDPDGNALTLAYDPLGRLIQVTDPPPYDAQVQRFAYDGVAASPPLLMPWTGPRSAERLGRTTYIDRRGSAWTFYMDLQTGDVIKTVDPLGGARRLTYDANHNLTGFQDELFHRWQYAYDASGNLTLAVDPLSHATQLSYNARHNLTAATNAAGVTVNIIYDDPANPTLPTSVIEPPDGQGNPAAVTALTHYGPDNRPEWSGLLERVTDPNGVVTRFEYDQYGQPRKEIEGASSGGRALFPLEITLYSNAGGFPIGSGNGYSCAELRTDPNGRIIESQCAFYCVGPILQESALSIPLPPSPLANAGKLTADMTASYSDTGRLLNMELSLRDPSINQWATRAHSYMYDELGRLRISEIATNEPTGGDGNPIVRRRFEYNPDVLNGTFDVVGTDGQNTHVVFDRLGRVVSVRRDAMTATYEYDAAGRPTQVVYGNGAQTVYRYDAANRLTMIRHESAGGDTMLQMDYAYTATDLISSIVETNAAGQACLLTFEYDNRNRLVRETRCTTGDPQVAYDIGYTYDQGGNRATKYDHLNALLTTYQYDLDHNRLLSTETFHLPETAPAATTMYEYNLYTGNPTLIVRKAADDPTYYGTWFAYAGNGAPVWMVAERTWQVNESGYPVYPSTRYVKEFRYDGGRARYMVRDREPGTLAPLPDAKWFDYFGDMIYSDYTVHPQTAMATNVTSHLPGLAQMQDGNVTYLHGDQIGTTRLLSGPTGKTVGSMAFTAFGEPAAGEGMRTRYGYAGAWGYQQNDPFAYLHIGARYYDPSVGRFLGRDPVGIFGGTNAFEYVESEPLTSVDPLGLLPRGAWELKIEYECRRKSGQSHDQAVSGITRSTATIWAPFLGIWGASISPFVFGWGALCWGAYRWQGGNTGNVDLDYCIDGCAIGAGARTGVTKCDPWMKRILRWIVSLF